jgi:putative SOS response-associated peptidase YedK
MCGRYASILPPDVIANVFGTGGQWPNYEFTWNMAPTKSAPIVVRDHEAAERRIEVAKWGLVPFFTKDLAKARKPINARCETVAKSPLFKQAFAHRRCLVPLAAYYEWRHDLTGKMPFAIARKDDKPIAFGGMWEEWHSPDGETLRTFATLTTEANPELALIQDRMPVIIEETDWPVWLGEADGEPQALMHAVPSAGLRVWPISRAVNSVKHDGPELLEPHNAAADEPALL